MGTPIISLTYKDAGVDIDAGQELVTAIAPLARSTRRSGSLDDLGGFGAGFDLRAAGYRDPILVAATDGVGTKLRLGIEFGQHRTLGIDLVAMCVNDLVVQGAEPLFFLDYYASGRLSVPHGREVVDGIAAGCRDAGCALIGGETAEMPGLYAPGDYDLAGFAVGAVERDRMLTGATIRSGDVVLGLASSGLHSNGFSLVRAAISRAGLALTEPCPFVPDHLLGAVLLEPTRIYVRSCLAAHRSGKLQALAHITGGGLLDNIPRVLPDGLACRLDAATWPFPEVFRWLRSLTQLPARELGRTFNCGIGMIAVVRQEHAASMSEIFTVHGERVFRIGMIEEASENGPRVLLDGVEVAWKS